MDFVEFNIDQLDIHHNQAAQVEAIVTPGRFGTFTLTLEVLGKKCFFLTETGLSRKISKDFDIDTIMQPQFCTLDFTLVALEGAFPTLTIFRAQTDSPANSADLNVNILETTVV